jgi:hypothetical protein
MKVLWRDPPRRTRWTQRLEPLKARPGEWARVHVTAKPEQAHSQAGALRAGKFAIPEGDWDFTSRKAGNGGEIYARYLGPKNEPVAVTTGR